MNINQAFPSQYLSKEDVKEPKVGVIKHVAIDPLKGDEGEEKKPALYFSNDLKPMILNRVNWMAIADLYGEDSDAWAGKSIELYHEPSIMFGSKRVGGVRVRKPGQPQHIDRAAMVEELTAIRAKIRELKPDLLPAKPTPEQIAGDGLSQQLTAHTTLLEAIKLESM